MIYSFGTIPGSVYLSCLFVLRIHILWPWHCRLIIGGSSPNLLKGGQIMRSHILLPSPSIFSAMCSCRSAGFRHLRNIVLRPERGKHLHGSLALSINFLTADSAFKIVAREKYGTPSEDIDRPQITEGSRLFKLQPEGYPCHRIDYMSESPPSTENDSSNSGFRTSLAHFNHTDKPRIPDLCHPFFWHWCISHRFLWEDWLDPFRIGAILGTRGCINSVIQMNFLPFYSKIWCETGVYLHVPRHLLGVSPCILSWVSFHGGAGATRIIVYWLPCPACQFTFLMVFFIVTLLQIHQQTFIFVMQVPCKWS